MKLARYAILWYLDHEGILGPYRTAGPRTLPQTRCLTEGAIPWLWALRMSSLSFVFFFSFALSLCIYVCTHLRSRHTYIHTYELCMYLHKYMHICGGYIQLHVYVRCATRPASQNMVLFCENSPKAVKRRGRNPGVSGQFRCLRARSKKISAKRLYLEAARPLCLVALSKPHSDTTQQNQGGCQPRAANIK